MVLTYLIVGVFCLFVYDNDLKTFKMVVRLDLVTTKETVVSNNSILTST